MRHNLSLNFITVKNLSFETLYLLTIFVLKIGIGHLTASRILLYVWQDAASILGKHYLQRPIRPNI